MHHVYLVPGFFGFAHLGGMKYFGPVQQHLGACWPEARVHTVPSHPTASLRERARRLHDHVSATSGPDDAVHLIGHSSGGLDARLLSTPGVALPGVQDPEPVAQRVRSVVTVATPHHGTPSAEFFSTLAGKQLLRVLSLTTLVTLRYGRVPVSVLVMLADWLRRGTSYLVEASPLMIDNVFDELLVEFTDERRGQVRQFFADVGEDQSLLPQITPDALHVFNAATGDRPGVRYGSVITRARRPGLVSALAAGWSPYAQTAHGSFVFLHTLAAQWTAAPLDPEHAAALAQRWPDGVTGGDNDGMVPTLSQPWGQVIRCVDADHLDVLGHYGDTDADPPRYDWFTTGTGFGRDLFEATWTDIAHFCE